MDAALALNLVREGQAAAQRGDAAAAEAAYLQAIAAYPDCGPAHDGLAFLRLPGAYYLDIISCIHATVRPKTYVEIGVDEGASLSRALPTTRCIGIDPAPKVEKQLSPQTTIFPMASDDFFAACDLRALLNGQPVELGFVDGLHLFEAALADFANLERYCAAGSAIILHDCLPLDPVTASRERQTSFWTGDTWRMLPTLARFRPDLSLTVIASPPSGLAIVRGLDPTSEVLKRDRDKAVAYGAGLDFAVTRSLAELGIEILPSDRDAVTRLFGKS